MSSDAPVRGRPGGRPLWVWALVAACVLVGIGLVVAVAGLLMPSGPAPVASPSPSPTAPSTTAGTPTPRTDLSAYGLADPLPFTAPPVWHAQPSASYRLTAAPDELRYVSDSGCTLAFRTRPLTAPSSPPTDGRTTAGSTPSRTATPGAETASAATPGAGQAAAQDPETAATLAALEASIEGVRAGAARAVVTEDGFTVVSTLGSLSGPLVDMAGAALRVTHPDGTVAYARLAVRAVPAVGAAMHVWAECPGPELAATAMNHASVHAFIAAT